MIDRRTLLAVAAASPFSALAARADDAVILRVVGEVTPENFDALWDLSARLTGRILGLKISFREIESTNYFAVNTHGVVGIVSTTPKGRRSLGFESGIRTADGVFFADGYYRVSREDAELIGLTPAGSLEVESAGKLVKVVEIDQLPVKN